MLLQGWEKISSDSISKQAKVMVDSLLTGLGEREDRKAASTQNQCWICTRNTWAAGLALSLTVGSLNKRKTLNIAQP